MAKMQSKRFIKKVPASGGAPVFKLTLPHSVVHTLLHHLVDVDFEIAASADAPQSWQGSITPRRNKDRSEYTLQGWKLFAEAHRVKAGDQVCFELVSPRRLVVQVISSADGNSPSHAAIIAETDAYQSPSKARKHCEHSSPAGDRSVQEDAVHYPGWPNESFLDNVAWGYQDICEPTFTTASDEGSSRMDREKSYDLAGGSIMLTANASPSIHEWQPDSAMTTLDKMFHNEAQNSETVPSASGSPGSNHTLFRQMTDEAIGAPSSGPLGGLGETIDTLFGKMEASSRAPPPTASYENSSAKLLIQLQDLNSTIQHFQGAVQDSNQRALNAESEMGRMKRTLEEMQLNQERQCQAALQANEGLEAAVKKLACSDLIASMSESSADAVLAIQGELYTFIDQIKASMWQLSSTGT